MKVSIKDILLFLKKQNISFSLYGQDNGVIEGFCSLQNYREGCITWAKTPFALTNLAKDVNIRAIIAQSEVNVAKDYSDCVIYSSESKRAFFSIIEQFSSKDNDELSISINTFISEKAIIANNVRIGSNCHICAGVEIGSGTVIGNNVSIESKTHIGSNCSIFSGTTIGTSGFGLYKDANQLLKRVAHYGGVWIDDNVEIGDNCVVNRGTIDDTYIGNGTKIDSLIHIPHNVHIGNNCIIIGNMGGSCVIGDETYLAPYSFIKNQVKVGKHCMVNCGVFLSEDLHDGYIAHKDKIVKLDYKRIINL